MLINQELFEKYFKKDSKNNFVNVDIGIFSELNEWVNNGVLKNHKHKTFTFAYYWLISYFWKYAKYGESLITIKEIKSLLGYSPVEKRLNYIVKKNGILDSKKYTEPTKDFPIHLSFGEENIESTMLSEIDDELQKDIVDNYGRNYFVKKPLNMLRRINKKGLMFSNDDALKLYIFEFTRIVLTKELGVDGFYLYSWLKLKGKMTCTDCVNVYYGEMVSEIGFGEKKIRALLQDLEKVGVIKINKDSEYSKTQERMVTINSYQLLYKGVIENESV